MRWLYCLRCGGWLSGEQNRNRACGPWHQQLVSQKAERSIFTISGWRVWRRCRINVILVAAFGVGVPARVLVLVSTALLPLDSWGPCTRSLFSPSCRIVAVSFVSHPSRCTTITGSCTRPPVHSPHAHASSHRTNQRPVPLQRQGQSKSLAPSHRPLRN